MVRFFPSLPLILGNARKRMMRKKMRRTKRAPVTSMEMSNKNRLLSWNEYPEGVILSIQKVKESQKPLKTRVKSSYFSFTIANIERWCADIAPLNDQKSSFLCKIKRKHFSKNDHTQTLLNTNVNSHFNTVMNNVHPNDDSQNIFLGIVPNKFSM